MPGRGAVRPWRAAGRAPPRERCGPGRPAKGKGRDRGAVCPAKKQGGIRDDPRIEDTAGVFPGRHERKKTFEARRDDRGFRAGDYLALNEWKADAGEYTGRCCLVRVTEILADEEYCKPGFVIMAFEPCSISSGPIPLLGGLQASPPAVYGRRRE